MGAATAACFAATRPQLVAAIALCELWLAPTGDACFHPAQAASFQSEAQAAAYLCAGVWVRACPPKQRKYSERQGTH